MLKQIIDYLALYFLFSTPYPYLVILAVLSLFFTWCAIFVKFKNSEFSVFLYILLMIIFILSASMIGLKWNETDDQRLDGQQRVVKNISRNGFLLDTGERIIPAGVEMPNRGFLRVLRIKVEELIDNKPITLNYSDRMGGYTMTTASGKDISEFLIENGYARPSKASSDYLYELASKSGNNVWLEAPPAPMRTPFCLAFKIYICYIALFVVVSIGSYIIAEWN